MMLLLQIIKWSIFMNICVFGAASSEIDNKYIESVERLCEKLAQNGHNLVFGAGGQGLMGAAARGFKKGGATITGVIPHFFKDADIEAIYDHCDELIYTDTMRERKAEMEERADAFLIVPGGIGTFEEMFEVLTLKQLGRHEKPIVIYNYLNYYDNLEKLINNSIREDFIRETCKTLYGFIDDEAEILKYLNKDNSVDYSVKQLKDG